MSESASLPAERRCAARVDAAFSTTLRRGDGATVAGEVANISATGMLVRAAAELPIWSTATATLPGAGLRDVRIVRRNGDCYGCLFQAPLDDNEFDAVIGSEEALAGLERLRIAAEAPPPPPPRRGLLRAWRR